MSKYTCTFIIIAGLCNKIFMYMYFFLYAMILKDGHRKLKPHNKFKTHNNTIQLTIQ